MSDSETSGAACELQQQQKSKLLEQMSLQRKKAGLKMDLNRAIRAYERCGGGDEEQRRDDIEKTAEELTAVTVNLCEMYAEDEKTENSDEKTGNYHLLY